MSMTIVGIGTANPPHTIAQADASEIAQQFACETAAQQRLFHTMYRRAGVESRHSAVLERSDGPLDQRQSFFAANDPTTRDRMRMYESHADGLAVAAASTALADAGIEASRVTHLITVSCTGFYAPSFDRALIEELGLSRGVPRTHVGFMGCHALLNGLRVAKAFCDADADAVPLVCAVELCSLHHQYGWDGDKIVANALFADGAAAMVGLGRGQGGPLSYRVLGTGSYLVPDSADAMAWRIRDHGFEMTLSPRVPDLIGEHLRPWLQNWLGKHGQSIETVGSWAVHPGGPRILSAFGESTGVPKAELETCYQVLASYGNMSSPTIGFILDRLRRAGAARPCVALGFGPGLAVEAVLLG
ncbi:MAG: type III polyketide synthase [Isosphaeraceae bacterium]